MVEPLFSRTDIDPVAVVTYVRRQQKQLYELVRGRRKLIVAVNEGGVSKDRQEELEKLLGEYSAPLSSLAREIKHITASDFEAASEIDELYRPVPSLEAAERILRMLMNPKRPGFRLMLQTSMDTGRGDYIRANLEELHAAPSALTWDGETCLFVLSEFRQTALERDSFQEAFDETTMDSWVESFYESVRLHQKYKDDQEKLKAAQHEVQEQVVDEEQLEAPPEEVATEDTDRPAEAAFPEQAPTPPVDDLEPVDYEPHFESPLGGLIGSVLEHRRRDDPDGQLNLG